MGCKGLYRLMIYGCNIDYEGAAMCYKGGVDKGVAG